MGLLNINNGVSQKKGINYTVIIDNINDDFGDVNNNTYFLDKQTQLVYYKNSTGDLVSIFEQGGSGNTIYSADDSLTDNRIVDLDNNSLTFEKGTVEIKGTGITTDTTLALYNGDATPSKTWEWLANGNVNINQTSTLSLSENKTLKIDGSSNTLENIFELNGGTNAFGTGVITVGSYGNVEIKGVNPLGNFKVLTMLGNEYFTLDGNGNNSTLRTKAFDIGTSTTTGYKIYEDSGRHEFVRLGIMGANFNLVNSDILFWEAGIDNKTFVVGGSTPIETEEISLQGNTLVSKKLELSSKEHGILLNRVTTPEMDSISITASDNEIVYNTELESLYRYDDPSGSWIALASGYGMVGVVRDSDNGVPTFYSDLQSALDTCKTVESYNTVTLYSNHTTTTGIIIDNTFGYKELTINFNGFKIENNQADDTHCLEVMGGVANNTTVLLDGSLIRENGTTGKCYQSNNSNSRRIRMSKMYMYNENYTTTWIGGPHSYDFGGSIFESGTGNTSYNTLQLGYGNFRNFTTISNSSEPSLFVVNSADVSHFVAKNTSTGSGIATQTSCLASNFYVETNSGNAVSGGILSNFVAKSVSGIAVSGPSSAHDFVATTGNNYAVTVGVSEISNFRAENNSPTLPCISLTNTLQCVQGYVRNRGSNYAISVFRNQSARSFSYNRITAISEGGIAANLSSNTGFKILFSHCEFVSKWDDVGGHSVRISGNDTVLTNCSFRVNNLGANNITSSSVITTKISNSTFDGATTPINTNVTLSNPFTSDPYGNVTL